MVEICVVELSGILRRGNISCGSALGQGGHVDFNRITANDALDVSVILHSLHLLESCKACCHGLWLYLSVELHSEPLVETIFSCHFCILWLDREGRGDLHALDSVKCREVSTADFLGGQFVHLDQDLAWNELSLRSSDKLCHEGLLLGSKLADLLHFFRT